MKKSDLSIPKIIKLPSGSYSTKVMVDGVRHTITRQTKKECEAEATAIKYRAKIAENNRRIENITLSEAIDAYIDKRRGKRSPATIKGYVSYRKNCMQSMMNANIYKTTDDQWQKAVDLDFCDKSPKYTKNAWSMFASAIEEITGNRPDIELPQVISSERLFLDPEQVITFVNAVKGQPVEIAALLALSSLRISEVLNVRGTDVDLIKNRIHVHGAAVYDENNQLIHKPENKTKSSARYVPIIQPLMKALENIPLTNDYLVNVSSNVTYKAINKICRDNGLPEVGNHGLRHSFASLAYHLNIPEKIAQEIGGWQDLGTMHKIYTHLAQKDIAKRSKDFTDFFAHEK